MGGWSPAEVSSASRRSSVSPAMAEADWGVISAPRPSETCRRDPSSTTRPIAWRRRVKAGMSRKAGGDLRRSAVNPAMRTALNKMMIKPINSSTVESVTGIFPRAERQKRPELRRGLLASQPGHPAAYRSMRGAKAARRYRALAPQAPSSAWHHFQYSTSSESTEQMSVYTIVLLFLQNCIPYKVGYL